VVQSGWCAEHHPRAAEGLTLLAERIAEGFHSGAFGVFRRHTANTVLMAWVIIN
jgi:hypothetical protein